MNFSLESGQRTRTLARVMGPYLVIVTVTALVRAGDMGRLVADFDASSAFTWVTGAVVLMVGLVVTALHQKWNGPAEIVVSALGWLTVLKGVMLLAVPLSSLTVATSLLGSGGWWRVGMIIMALVGAYLCWVGWAGGRKNAATSSPDAARTVVSRTRLVWRGSHPV